MHEPIADMRGVKFFDTDQQYYQKNTGFLCERCGHIRSCTEVHEDVIECYGFMPIIKFAPPFGNMDDVFNTIRLGRAWVSRLKSSSVVMLMNANTKEFMGKAVVISVSDGDMGEVCRTHYSQNHLMKGEVFENDRRGEAKIRSILKRCYGKMYYDNATGASVIYMKMVEGS